MVIEHVRSVRKGDEAMIGRIYGKGTLVLVLCLSTIDGDRKVGHCQPVHCGPRTSAGDDGRLLADGLGTAVIVDSDVDN